ncbi:hypothetical protein IW140_000977 [Coemansia sp. RSA 1813]|nr:hypothetical protein EV178_003969 [Coemansia sp. RSA 1646]KAJ1773354.1 hypothetical protein LPJ74_000607 [Coemansia sp. RSA 1843]KAJ2091572.1 hypothetical protein IW138_001800 [Coemansia sp. RSA 986]KAJ2212044.1 hypothetical protein EV179_004970 [Coemansia sp. RSA 487]KAJ2572228.1 hypothetical protein IW140_000977 [Coemansia sp. RSA 1813]
MSQDDIAEGFIHWVGTFDSLSKPVSNPHDLTDGIALFEICAEIDRQWFKSIRSADIGDNWVLKLNNLKKLYKLVTQYYEEVLGYPASNLAEPNLSAIAKEGNGDELLKLCHLILTLAVQCERNQVYIGKIMSLGEEDQRSLMVSIESVLAQLGSAEPDTDPDGHDVDMMDTSMANDDGVDPVARLQAELMKSYAEKDEMEKSAHELSVEHKQVQTKYEELLVLNEELKARMEDLERSMARADKTGKVDFILRAEIENLKHDLEKADTRFQEAERINKSQEATLAELTRKLSDSEEAKDEAMRLRDQLQEYKHAAERLAKSEHVIEKYKKKLEESTDLRRQVRSLEEQLAQAQDRSRQIEDEYKRVSQLRPAMDNYRDEFIHLESQHNVTVAELSQAMERLRQLESEQERMCHDKQRDHDLIMSLEENLREMELKGVSGSSHDTGTTLESGMQSALSSEDRIELLSKVARLERELEEANNSPNNDASEFLEMMTENTDRERQKAVAELEKEREHRQELEKQLRSAELAAEESVRVKDDLKQLTEKLVSGSAEISNMHSELAQAKEELERAKALSLANEREKNAAHEALRRLDNKEAASLRNENKSLEGWYSETHEQSKEFKAEVDRLSAENRQLTQRLSKLQEDLTRLDIGKREAESEGQRMAQALEKQKAALASSASLQFSQSDVDRLQKELVKSRDEVHALQINLKRTKDHCIQLDHKLKTIHVDTGSRAQEDYKEVLMSLQSQLAMKDEQLNSMNAMLREQNSAHMLESRAMASAWSNLQSYLEIQSGFSHSSGKGTVVAAASRQSGTPSSWLAQQRVTLDMQLNG